MVPKKRSMHLDAIIVSPLTPRGLARLAPAPMSSAARRNRHQTCPEPARPATLGRHCLGAQGHGCPRRRSPWVYRVFAARSSLRKLTRPCPGRYKQCHASKCLSMFIVRGCSTFAIVGTTKCYSQVRSSAHAACVLAGVGSSPSRRSARSLPPSSNFPSSRSSVLLAPSQPCMSSWPTLASRRPLSPAVDLPVLRASPVRRSLQMAPGPGPS